MQCSVQYSILNCMLEHAVIFVHNKNSIIFTPDLLCPSVAVQTATIILALRRATQNWSAIHDKLVRE